MKRLATDYDRDVQNIAEGKALRITGFLNADKPSNWAILYLKMKFKTGEKKTQTKIATEMMIFHLYPQNN